MVMEDCSEWLVATTKILIFYHPKVMTFVFIERFNTTGGYTTSAIVGASFYQFVHPSDVHLLQEAIARGTVYF